MRIAVVTETYPPEINGVALTVRNFVEELLGLGHDVVLTRPRQPAHDRDAAESAPRNRAASLARDVDRRGATTDATLGEVSPATRSAARGTLQETRVAGLGIPRYPGLRFGLPAASHLKALWRRDLPDAVYVATEGPLGGSALRAARALGIPVATGFHTRFDDFVAHYGLRWLSNAVFATLRRFHNRAQATLVPTAELEAFLSRSGFRNVRLLARGVDVRLFDPARRDPGLRLAWGLAPDALCVVHVGRLAPEKNLGVVTRAFDAIKAARRDAHLVWVGDGPARAALERARPHDTFVGMRRGIDLARHFASGDLFLFPSLTETFGNVTIEALASGVPPVAYDYGAARERVVDGSNGRAVAFDDEAAFVAAAVELARDDAARDAMRLHARASVLHLSPEAVARALATLLESLAVPAGRTA